MNKGRLSRGIRWSEGVRGMSGYGWEVIRDLKVRGNTNSGCIFVGLRFGV